MAAEAGAFKAASLFDRRICVILAVDRAGYRAEQFAGPGHATVGTDAPTVLLADRYRPVGYGASLLLSIRKNTLFGKWPAPLANSSAR
jgi:hypothetical protein